MKKTLFDAIEAGLDNAGLRNEDIDFIQTIQMSVRKHILECLQVQALTATPDQLQALREFYSRLVGGDSL